MLSTIVCNLFLSFLFTRVIAVDQTRDPSLDAQLKEAPTFLDRSALLPNDEDWFFDFNVQPITTYSPGSVVNANAATFPAMAGLGMTLAMLNLGPCAMLPPHMHPRATNMVMAIEGTTNTFMISENGARMVSETLRPGQMTIFPRASLHTMQNTGSSHNPLSLPPTFLFPLPLRALSVLTVTTGCGNATLVSALDSDDTGTTNIVTQLLNFPPGMVRAAFGNNPFLGNLSNLAAFAPGIGTGSILGDAACIAACKNAGNSSGNSTGNYTGNYTSN
jgi:hypothetical protein